MAVTNCSINGCHVYSHACLVCVYTCVQLHVCGCMHVCGGGGAYVYVCTSNMPCERVYIANTRGVELECRGK